MRIGILTFHKPVNYGAFLQAFSLSERLRKEFPQHEVEIIDYIAPKEARQIYINILRDFKHGGLQGGMRSIKKVNVFRQSQKYLQLSPKSFCKEDLQAFYDYIKERYDCLVIGSDAVFNWNQNGFPSAFIPDYDFGIPVFTYAASVHGLRYYEAEPDKLATCANAFEKMTFVGVRDACTEKFVQYCLPGATPQFCCDPTLFIDGEKVAALAGDYAARIEKKHGISLTEKYIVLMAPDSMLTKCIAEKYRRDYRIISLFKNSKYADAFLYDLNPFEWAMVLRGACATVTSYFHGTLLSLVQGTPTVVLDYSGYTGQYQGKLDDLLRTRLDLPELYFEKKFAAEFDGNEEFYVLFDKVLSGAFRERIAQGIQKAAESFQYFKEALKMEKGE